MSGRDNGSDIPLSNQYAAGQTTGYVTIEKVGTTATMTIRSGSHTGTVTGTSTMTVPDTLVGLSHLHIAGYNNHEGTNRSGNFILDSIVIESDNVVYTPIISATGLSDNTSTAKNYVFTRSGNDWTIYQNGMSQATATDSTSLGVNSVASTLTQEFT